MDITLEATGPATDIEAVYRAHAARLWRSLLAWTGDAAITDDAVAEAFAQALRRGDSSASRNAGSGEPPTASPPGPSRNGVVPGARSRRPPITLTTCRLDSPRRWPRLPSGQRAAVVLHYYADLRVREVAEVLGMSSAAVKVSLMRARRRLRTFLESSDG